MRKIIEHDFEIRVFENVKFFYKTHKLAVINKSKNDFKIRHYLKDTIELVKRKFLFNKIINNECYDVDRICKDFVSFNQGC